MMKWSVVSGQWPIAVALAAVLLVAVPALAAEEPGTRAICEKFVETVKAGPPGAARDKVLALWDAQKDSPNSDFIDRALRTLNMDYARAALRVDADRLDEASALIESLEQKPADKFTQAAIEFLAARLGAKQRNWDYAVQKLERLRGKGDLAEFALPKREIDLLTARAWGRVARLDEAIELAKTRADTPEGRRLLSRLEAERDGATLDDVAGVMDDVKSSLNSEKTGDDTQQKEDKIIAMLEMLIEQAEDQEQGGGGGGGGGGGQNQGQSQGQGPPQGTGIPSSPATQSALPGGAANDEGKAAATATMGDFWAKLPPRDRAKVMDALRGRLPARYRDLIEAYYKSLSEGNGR